MKIYFVFGITILLFFATLAIAGQYPASASIQATATVAQPIGLIEAQQSGDALGVPVLAQCASRWFLYVPILSNVLVQLDGRLLEISNSTEIISALDLTEFSGQSTDSLVVTLVYSEN